MALSQSQIPLPCPNGPCPSSHQAANALQLLADIVVERDRWLGKYRDTLDNDTEIHHPNSSKSSVSQGDPRQSTTWQILMHRSFRLSGTVFQISYVNYTTMGSVANLTTQQRTNILCHSQFSSTKESGRLSPNVLLWRSRSSNLW